MFKIGDAIVCANVGLCRIDDIRMEDFLGEKQLFYMMNPVYFKGSTIFLPVENPKIVMRSPVSRETLSEVLSIEVDAEKSWIENMHERRTRFSEILKTCDIKGALIALRTLLHKRAEKQHRGKKIHMADEKAITNIEKMLFSEIAYVLGISYDEVGQMFTVDIE